MAVWTYSGNVYNSSPAGTTTFPLVSGAGYKIDYLQRSHIHVSSSVDEGYTWIELTVPTDYSLNSEGTEVVLAVGIAEGTRIKVQRKTPYLDEYVNFQSSSLLTADQLNTAELFSMYVDQEQSDQINSLAFLGLKYLGATDLTVDLPPSIPVNGDFFINTGTGVVLEAWAGIGGSYVVGSEQAVYDSAISSWRISNVPENQKGVLEITGTSPIEIDNTDKQKPNVSITPETYVEVIGDNMTGDLTLGTDKIQLNATNGDASFAGTINELTVSRGPGNESTNTVVGTGAVASLTTGRRVTGIGASALVFNESGDDNTAVGSNVLGLNVSGDGNTAIGASALLYSEGDKNTAVGAEVGLSLSTGSNNIIIGSQAEPSAATVSNEATIGDANISKFRVPGVDFVLKDNGGTPSSGQVLTADSNGEGYWADSSGGGGGVNQIVAGNNITIDPVDGLGTVTINSTGGGTGAGVSSIIAGDGIIVDQSTGDVTITRSDSYGDTTITGELTVTGDAEIDGLTVGLGGSNQFTNTAFGRFALLANTTGNHNTGVGFTALDKNDIGSNNTAIGANALEELQNGDENTVVGASAGIDVSTGEKNTAVGYKAMSLVTDGSSNTVIGSEAATTLTSGDENILVGHNAEPSSSSVSGEITIGNSSIAKLRIPGLDFVLKENNGTPSTGQVLTADANGEGYWADAGGGTPGDGTITLQSYGEDAAASSTFSMNQSGNATITLPQIRYNDIDGTVPIPSNYVTNSAGYVNARNNFSYGSQTGTKMESPATYNFSMFYRSMSKLEQGGNNIAIGSYSFYSPKTANNCIAIGKSALQGTSNTGDYNIAIGFEALEECGASNNIAIGPEAAKSLTTGVENIAIGGLAGSSLTTGDNNLIITGAVLGVNQPVFNVTTQDDRLVLGHTSITDAYVRVTWTVVSDERDKMNFAPVPYGLDFVNQLKPTAYQFKENRDTETAIGDVRYGFKAQDILALEGKNPVIIDTEDADHLKYKGEHLVPVLVNAVQELTAMVNELKAEVIALKGA